MMSDLSLVLAVLVYIDEAETKRCVCHFQGVLDVLHCSVAVTADGVEWNGTGDWIGHGGMVLFFPLLVWCTCRFTKGGWYGGGIWCGW